MSLVLDALKKLEREKATGEPGVLVVGAVPWHRGRGHLPRIARAVAALLVLVAVAYGAWRLGRRAPTVLPGGSVDAEAASATRPATTPPATAATGAGVASLEEPLGTTTSREPPPARRLALPASLPGAASPTEPREVSPRGSNPQLNAISRQDGRPVAVIDGRIVREGDSFEGVRVLRIGETEVEIEQDGERRTLRF